MDKTKTSILDAAERLFGERGIAATSHRAITGAAGVNVAAINYHFGSKEGLIRCVFERRLRPVNQKRLELLSACEAEHTSDLPLEKVVEAYFAPVVQLGPKNSFRPLMGRMYTESGDLLQAIIQEQMAEIAHRFTIAFKRALPALSEVDLFWGAFFTIGMLAHTVHGVRLLQAISGGRCDAANSKEVTQRVVTFVSAGLRSLTANQKNSACNSETLSPAPDIPAPPDHTPSPASPHTFRKRRTDPRRRSRIPAVAGTGLLDRAINCAPSRCMRASNSAPESSIDVIWLMSSSSALPSRMDKAVRQELCSSVTALPEKSPRI